MTPRQQSKTPVTEPAPPASEALSAVATPSTSTATGPVTESAPSIQQLTPPVINRSLQRRAAANIIQEIQQTLPTGIDLYRSYRYQMPLMRDTFDLVVLKLTIPLHLENKLTEWRRAIEERHPATTILINRVEVEQSLQNNLLNKFKYSERLGPEGIPTLQAMIATLCGSEPAQASDARTHKPLRENFTQVPFIAPDRPETIDQEDLIYGERKADGTLVLRTAFIDITDEITPGSDADKYALRVGSTVYGRRRAVSPVGSARFGGAASFKVGEIRPAWVVECKISRLHESSEHFKVRRGWVVNHANLDPSKPFDINSNKEVAKNLSALADITRILEHRRNLRSSFIRIDGEGSAARIVAETMIHSKRLLARYLSKHCASGAIYRVHQKPSAQMVDEYVEALHELKIPGTRTDFESPLAFAGILRSLEEHGLPQARSLSNKLLDTFLLRTQYSQKNLGHYGLRLPEYLEIKPRDATGIANQFQLDAIFTGATPLPEKEIVRRATALNDKRWSRDERMYKLRFMEMLSERLEEVGKIFLAEVSRVGSGPTYCQVDTFSKWGVVRDTENQRLAPGDLVALKLSGFNLRDMRFEFSLTEI